VTTRRLLSLHEAAERLASRGVGQRVTAVGAPPIARRGPKGEAFYSSKELDAWAAALPRRGRIPNARDQARGEDGEASRAAAATRAPQPPSWFAGGAGAADDPQPEFVSSSQDEG
jgi:hypothetical protein